jgi:putative component of membrane protein insertase Oxa1/YidC/SpoIIIJ protein YidD
MKSVTGSRLCNALFVLVLSAGTSWPDNGGPASGERVPGCIDGLFFQYRLLIRDLLDRRCAFSPSCSHYGQEAVAAYGPLIGPMMAVERWLRCHSRARLQGYYGPGEGYLLSDPLEVEEVHETWDSLLLPF